MNVGMNCLPSISQQEVAKYLVMLVCDGKAPVTYSDLLEQFGHPPISQRCLWHQSPMKGIFSLLDKADISEGRPLRTTMVIRKDTKLPGNGYFRTLAGCQAISIPRSKPERLELHEAEMARLVALYRPANTTRK